MIVLFATLPIVVLPIEARDLPADTARQVLLVAERSLPAPYASTPFDRAVLDEHLAAAGPACRSDLVCLCSVAVLATGTLALDVRVSSLSPLRGLSADVQLVRPCEDEVVDRRAAIVEAGWGRLDAFIAEAAGALLRGRDLGAVRYSGSRAAAAVARPAAIVAPSAVAAPVAIAPAAPVAATPSARVGVAPSAPVTVRPSAPVTAAPSAPVAAAPSTPVAAGRRGFAELARGDYAGAEQELTGAINNEPHRVDLLVARGRARLGLGQMQQALADFGLAHALAGDLAEPLYGLAEANRRLGHTSAAVHFYKQYSESGDADLRLLTEARLWLKALAPPAQ